MKIYELRYRNSKLKTWICADTVIEALRTEYKIHGLELQDYYPDDDIVELPRDKWKDYFIFDEEDDANEQGTSFEEYMKDNIVPDILASTVY